MFRYAGWLRRFFVPVLLVVLLLPPVDAQSRSYYWQRWDVVIDEINTTQNQFRVTEIYDYVFSGTYRFGTAYIPTDRLNALDDIRVEVDGQVLSVSCTEQLGTVCVTRESGGVFIRYVFPQVATDRVVHAELSYTVTGALRSYPDGDQLSWFAVTDDHAVRVENTNVVVKLPQDAVPRPEGDPYVTYGAPAEIFLCESLTCGGIDLGEYINNIEPGGAVLLARASNLGPDVPLEIRFQYPHNPEMGAPSWQAAFDTQREFEEGMLPVLNVGSLILAALIGVGGPLGAFALYWTRGRDPHVGPVPEYLAEPPDDLPPAVVGTLLDENADMRDILSTLIHLAERGHLVIEEERKEGFLGLGGGSEFTFKRTDSESSSLSLFEQKLMRYVFRGRQERELDALKNKFYTYLPDLKSDLYRQLVSEGLFRRSPETTRNTWSILGVVLLVLGFLGTFLLLDTETELGLIPLIPGAVGVSGVAFLLFSQFMPAKTQAGALAAAKWLAFRNYLSNLERFTSVEEASDRMTAYLPYAIAFGIDKTWINKFRNLEDVVSLPPWYWPRHAGGYRGRGYTPGTPLPSPGGSFGGGFSLDDASGGLSSGLNSLSDGMSRMLNSASNVLSSRPSSSGGSGGFSGGGFSGGGSSGGGSRGAG